eukprot:m.136480 g.136480  ORF g.136480 m.136480 type:complete len:396 (+) comp17572_c0_seq4:99-1286(+)
MVAFAANVSIDNEATQSFHHVDRYLPRYQRSTLQSIASIDMPRTFKGRMLMLWNNAVNTQYFTPRWSPDSPVWLLGERYCNSTTGDPHGVLSSADHHTDSEEHLKDLMLDIRSRIWLTYREGFPRLLDTAYTSDMGWGCMIRSGQMLLAQALLVSCVGRGFRCDQSGDTERFRQYRRVLQLFYDDPARACPFSIHNLLRFVAPTGVHPGHWMGPTPVCRAISGALKEVSERGGSFFGDLAGYVALDCLVSKSEIWDVIQSSGSSWRPILILIPLRLGVHKMNKLYVPALQNVFMHNECVGIIGGKPRHSLYFVGFQGDELIGLDPHQCQPAVGSDGQQPRDGSYHCSSPRKIKFATIDPSLALGFLCRTKAELDNFFTFSETVPTGVTPLYSVQD